MRVLVDLCVVNFNTYPKLMRLCSELQMGQRPDLYRLLIADNGSVDNSVHMLKSRAPQNVDEIMFNANIGYASACNQLAAMGEAPIIGLLNSDVWFTSGHLQHIVDTFNSVPEVAILGPKQRDEQNKITHAGIFGTEEHPKIRGWKKPDPGDRLYCDREEAITVAGSAYFIRRSVWDELTNCSIYQTFPVVKKNPYKGAFLPTPHYFEERACSAHARAHGYRVFYDGTVSIGHSWHASHAIGSRHDKQFKVSKKIYQEFCDFHGIPRES